MADKNAPLIPEQGWHCLHLFYRIDFAQWQLLTADERRTAKIALSEIVQEIRATEKTQLLTLSVVTPKADIAFMLITPDLHAANSFEKRLNLSLGAGVVEPVYSYLSLTEESEYTTTAEQYAEALAREQNLKPGTPEFDTAMKTFAERMAHYREERLYPTLPDWPVVCFYNMSKRRGEQRAHDRGIPPPLLGDDEDDAPLALLVDGRDLGRPPSLSIDPFANFPAK